MIRFSILAACFSGLFLCDKVKGEEFYGSIEALYWQPTHSPIVAGRQIGPDGGGLRPRENLLIDGSYDWGFRVQGGYDACSFFVDLSYLHYNSSTKESFQAAPGSVIRMPSGSTTDNLRSLQSELDFKYQNVNLCYGYYFIRDCCWEVYTYCNARWLKLNFSNFDVGARFTIGSRPETFLQKSNFHGGGLGVGVGAAYSFWKKLALHFSCGSMIILGDHNHDVIRFFESDIANALLTVDEKPRVFALPEIEFRLAISYPFCLSRLHFLAEIGYELDYYFNIIRHNIGIDRDGADDVVQLSYFGAGFGGPFVRLSVGF